MIRRLFNLSLAGLTLCVCLIALAPAATAQTTPSLAASIEAQYRLALIRERRLASERELQTIASAETRMRDARHQLAAATRDRAAAERALASARADFVRLVNNVPLREAVALVAAEAFRAEFAGVAAQATPQMLEAYREFADGDRVAAWAALDVLLHARASARQIAAAAAASAEISQLARLRLIMRAHSEATTEDVITLYAQATSLFDGNYQDWFELSRLYIDSGDLPLAQRAAERALAANPPPFRRTQILKSLGDTLLLQGHPADARGAYAQSLAASQEIEGVNRQVGVAFAQEGLGHVASALGDEEAARAAFSEERRVLYEILSADPDQMDALRGLIVANAELGLLSYTAGDQEQSLASYREAMQFGERVIALGATVLDVSNFAMATEGAGSILLVSGQLEEAETHFRRVLELRRPIAAADASAAKLQTELASALSNLSMALGYQGRTEEAEPMLDEALGISRQLAAQFPDNWDLQRGFSIDLNRKGEILQARGDDAGAAAVFRESLAVIRRVAAANPSSGAIANDVLYTMMRLSQAVGEDPPASRAVLAEAIALGGRSVAQHPDDASLALTNAYLYCRVGEVESAEGRQRPAVRAFNRCARLIEPLRTADPSNAWNGWTLLEARFRGAQVSGRRSDMRRALSLYAQLGGYENRAVADPWTEEIEAVRQAQAD